MGRGWRRIVFPGIFLVYLLQVVGATADDSKGAARRPVTPVVVTFCVCYSHAPRLLETGPAVWGSLTAAFGGVVGGRTAVRSMRTPSLMCVFIVVVSVARLGGRSTSIVIAMTLMALFVPLPSLRGTTSLSTAVDNGTAISIPMIALAMFGFLPGDGGATGLWPRPGRS